MKKIMLGVVIGVCVSMSSMAVMGAVQNIQAQLSDEYTILINGVEQPQLEDNIINYNGYTYAPIRDFIDALGFSIEFDQATNTIAIDTTVSEEVPVSDTDTSTDGTFTSTVSTPIARDSVASVDITGEPNTEYTIEVHYPDGVSKAEGLEPKTTDAEGNVTWEWNIGPQAPVGTHKIVITGGGETYEAEITITE